LQRSRPMPLDALASDRLDSLGRGYPRPQLRRAAWYSLNGEWEFALDPDARWSDPAAVHWASRIRVPFSPETAASGLSDTGFYRACWYRRRIARPPLGEHERLVLHFGAVDYHATLWINGAAVGCHEGGYTPFCFDITGTGDAAELELVVRSFDDPQDLSQPRGKQDWQLEPHSIWYPRTTGIWQTVWLERVPRTSIRRVAFTPNMARWEIGLEAWVDPGEREDLRLGLKLNSQGRLLAADTYTVVAGEVHRRIALSDPGVDDSRNELLWSPQAPNLIDVQLELWGDRGELLDSAVSYTALRTAGVQGDRFVLNNRPYQLRMVLDQGYWPESGLTAPDDEALKKDVIVARSMGFNGVRKHQKLEDPRYLYWADRLGLAVWGEMPSTYRFTPGSVDRVSREWSAAIARDFSHPCIIAWVPINESWGVPNLPENPRERHFVQALYHLTRTLDPTRPVIGNDGWESVATDIIGIHDYDDHPQRIAKRYHAEDVLPRLFKRERPGGRLLVLEGQQHADQPLMLTEFGGIAFSRTAQGTWGYTRVQTPEELGRRFRELLSVVRNLGLMSGFCYTQFADTYQEANGLLFADRTPKIPLDQIAEAVSGPTAVRADGLEQIVAHDPDLARF
jgi:beta-galactosidase/beta-glucuronidase